MQQHLNEWAHENLQSIRSMDRDAWLNLDEEYKRPAFNALTPEQKLLFWKDKLKEVMTSFEWSEPERQHLMKMYRYLEEHPDIYEPDFFCRFYSERKTSISLLQLGLLML